jgi:hypothetical protein
MQVPTIQHMAAHMGGGVRHGQEAAALGRGHSTMSLSITINNAGEDHDSPHRGAKAEFALMSPVKAAASPAPTLIVIG